MTMISEAPGAATEQDILVRHVSAPQRGMADLIVRATRDGGAGPFRQWLELLRLQFSRRAGMTAKEYYANQLYRKALGAAERRAFVGEMGNFRLNQKLSPPMLTQMRGFIADKIAFGAVLRQLGVPTTQEQAAFAKWRNLGTLPTLRSAVEVAGFLRDHARYPVFGKPVDGLQAVGSVSVRGIDRAADTLELMNGRVAAVEALARDIAESYPGGFLFQDAIAQHPAIVDVIGPAVACVRAVTVMAGETPEVLYAIWKIPSPSAMSDNFWQAGNMLALPDAESGEIVKCRRGTGPDTEWIETHPASGRALCGFRLPHWQAAREIAVSTHAMFPSNGVLGWDIAIGPDGPIIIECNENPAHTLYQMAADRGIYAAGFGAAFDRVIARNKAALKAVYAAEMKARRER